MTPLRRHFCQWNQYKSPVLKPRMRKNQLRGGLDTLPLGRQIHPAALYHAIGQDLIINRQQVYI